MALGIFGTGMFADAQAPATKPLPRLSLRIALADARSPLREILVQTGEKDIEPAAVHPFRIGDPITLKTMPERLNFFTKGADGVPVPLASVAVPGGMKHVLAVLAPDAAKASSAHQAFVLNEAEFPAQSIWFLNSTPRPVAIQLGAAWETINAGATHLFRPASQDGEPLRVQMVFYEKQKWQTFSSTRWLLPPGQRHLIFFNVNPRTERMDYNSLTDYLAP